METNQNNNNTENKAAIEKTASDGNTPNVGAGPVSEGDINNGGSGGATQPKEHTGKQTEMGGATGGTPGLPDASEGNDNTRTAG
jgi:hypothetical protein